MTTQPSSRTIRPRWTLLFALCAAGLFALACSSCGDVEAGEACEGSEDCDDGMSCVPIAFGCVDTKICESTCEVTCSVDEDCGAEEACVNRNGHLICADRDPEQPFE